MKPKLNFDWNSIQQFLLRNVEKFAFGLVLLAFLFFVLGAYHRVGGYPKTPEELGILAEEAEEKIKSTEPEEGGEVPDYVRDAEKIRIPIEAAPYTFPLAGARQTWRAEVLPGPGAPCHARPRRGGYDQPGGGGGDGGGGGGGPDNADARRLRPAVDRGDRTDSH